MGYILRILNRKEAAAYLESVNEEAYFEDLDAEAMVSVGQPAERIVR